MEGSKFDKRWCSMAISIMFIVIVPVYGQITTPCTTSMVSSFTPCINYITGSTGGNGASPTADCCSSLRSLVSGSMGCACLLVTAGVPLQLPINRTLSISLPRACKIGGVPLQCKASGAPLPSPGPLAFGPAPSPGASSAKSAAAPAEAPAESSPTDMTPATSPVASETPTLIPGQRPVLTPNAASKLSQISSTSLVLVLAMMILN